MSEGIENLKLLIKNDRRIMIGAGFLVFCLLLLAFIPSGKSSKVRKPINIQNPTEMNLSDGDNAAWKDLLLVTSNSLEEIKDDNKSIQEDLVRMKKEREQDKSRTIGILDGLLDKMENIASDVVDLREEQNRSTKEVVEKKIKVEAPVTENIEGFGFQDTDLPPPPPKKPKGPLRISHITAGDNVSLQLLTGIEAPVDGTPYPVMFKINGPITGPDGSLLDVGEARIIAAAEGIEGNSRVIFRLSELAIRHNNGRRSVIQVDGWIVGEDGSRGMRGQLRDNLGETMVALSTIATGQFLGDRVRDRASGSRSNNTDESFVLLGNGGNSISPGDIQSSIALGVTDTFQSMAEIIIERYRKQIPVVAVNPGRTVQAIFSSNSEVELISEDGDESIYYDSSLS
jgi:conjugal transfer pilus assembly protein TraB